MPHVLDTPLELKGDSVLEELSYWATTIIRIPITRSLERIEADISDFRLEFLLFAPAVRELRLMIVKDDAPVFDRTARCLRRPDDVVHIEAADVATDWRVWSRVHQPTDEALEEVGTAIRRKEVTVSWAAPLQGLQDVGAFWAFFPLLDRTSVRGILNAPWQVNDDRTNLLPGQFNNELLETAANLIVEGLPLLTSLEDPARHFDYLPARDQEAANFADLHLIRRIPVIAAQTAVVPDANGRLQRPDTLRYLSFRHAPEFQAVKAWHAAPGRPVAAPHWSCYQTRTRRARLRGLVRSDNDSWASTERTAADWLAQLTPDGSDEQCQSALRVLQTVTDESMRKEMLAARVVPDENDKRHSLNAVNEVFLHGDILTAAAGITLIRPTFLAQAGVEASLRELGFSDIQADEALVHVVRLGTAGWKGPEWRAFWRLVENVPPARATELLERFMADGGRLRLLNETGTWEHPGAIVVPGIVEPIDQRLCIDMDFHGRLNNSLLQRLGVGPRPVDGSSMLEDSTVQEFLRVKKTHHLKGLSPGTRPTVDKLEFAEGAAVGPLHLLRRFADTSDTEARIGWSQELLKVDTADKWRLQVKERGNKRRTVAEYMAPHLWAIRRYGLIATAWGPREPALSVDHRLASYDALLPVADNPRTDKLCLPAELAAVSDEIWSEFLSRTPATDDPESLGRLIGQAVIHVPDPPPQVPALLGTTGGLTPPVDLLLATTAEQIQALRGRNLPYVAIEDSETANLLQEKWGCRPAGAVLSIEPVADGPCNPHRLFDRFRALYAYVDNPAFRRIELVACQDLHRQISGPDGMDQEAYRSFASTTSCTTSPTCPTTMFWQASLKSCTLNCPT